MSIQNRLQKVNKIIENAVAEAGREQGSVKLIAISKTHPAESVEQAYNAGHIEFGESRVQEAEEKITSLNYPLKWHLVGHLQSNKAKAAVSLFHTIHSVDSIKLIKELDKRAIQIDKRIAVMLQVNVSGEAAKSGMNPDDLPEIADAASCAKNLDLTGLMTIPPFSVNPEDSRRYFAALRELAMKDLVNSNLVSADKLELSMGMSGDFTIAIQEGSTLVRVGTAIFGHR